MKVYVGMKLVVSVVVGAACASSTTSTGQQSSDASTETGSRRGDARRDSNVVLDARRADAGRDVGTAREVAGPSACSGVTCSGLGTCVLGDGEAPTCQCEKNLVPSGLTCVANPCENFTCSGRCAQCMVVNGAATCGCGSGWTSNGAGGCTPDPSPCDPDPCTADEVCTTEIHCVVSGECLQGCDCSNCGSSCSNITFNANCGGSDDAGLPLVVCNIPCASGDGCIPTGGSPWGMCYPMEGCLSK